MESAAFEELRSAVNAVPAAGVVINGAHVTALRAELNAALQMLGLPTASYTDPSLDSTVPIRLLHVTELRERTQ